MLSGTFFHYLLFIFLWLHFILHLFHSLNGNLNHTVEQSEILQEFVEYFRCNLANIFDHKCLAGSMYLFKFGKEKFEQFFQYSYVWLMTGRCSENMKDEWWKDMEDEKMNTAVLSKAFIYFTKNIFLGRVAARGELLIPNLSTIKGQKQ